MRGVVPDSSDVVEVDHVPKGWHNGVEEEAQPQEDEDVLFL